MGDIFKEQLIKRKFGKKEKAKMVVASLGAIVAALILSVTLQFIAPFLILAIIYGLYFLYSRLSIEYEYVFTNGELDIDIIFNKSKRKNAFNITYSEIEIFTSINDKENEHLFKNVEKTFDFSSGVNTEKCYMFLASHKNQKVKVVFEPNESILKGFKTYMTPRKFIIDTSKNL